MKQLRKFLKDERGVASVWIGMLIALFGASIIYALTYDILVVQIFNIAIDIAPSNTPQAFFNNIDRFRMLYKILPFVFFFGIILWSFVKAQKREYAT